MKKLIVILLFSCTPHAYQSTYNLKNYEDFRNTRIGHYYIYEDPYITELRQKISEDSFIIIEHIDKNDSTGNKKFIR